MLEDRRVRLPPLAKLQVEEATTALEAALDAGRRAMQLLTSNPAGAALELAQLQDMTYQAKWKLQKACTGVAGVQERKTASATNADRLLRTRE